VVVVVVFFVSENAGVTHSGKEGKGVGDHSADTVTAIAVDAARSKAALCSGEICSGLFRFVCNVVVLDSSRGDHGQHCSFLPI
jgi:hypothetical protein